MRENRILSLLEQGDWGEDTALIQGLKTWRFYPLLLETYQTMDEDALYKSRVHGSGHIHRVLLFAALIAWQEGLEEEDVRQYFRAASPRDNQCWALAQARRSLPASQPRQNPIHRKTCVLPIQSGRAAL